MKLQHDVRLAELTTLRLGGPAGTLVTAETTDELVAAIRDLDRPLLIGGGSNLVIADSGVAGAIRLATHGVEVRQTAGDGVELRIAAGEQWDELVTSCVEQGWRGLESLAGIPGLTGAAPVQNIGAYGHELAEVLTAVQAYDMLTGELVELTAADCGFGYRTSRFKQLPRRYVITAVTLRLAADVDSLPVCYDELASRLGVPVGATASLAAVREAVLELRRAKGMVLDADDHDTWSAGSFFTNPILAPGQVPTGAPSWPVDPARVKTSAAWLISRAGVQKGYAIGGAAVSGKHLLALTNTGTASTAELVELARYVRDRVRAVFQITLEPEPVLVGCSL